MHAQYRTQQNAKIVSATVIPTIAGIRQSVKRAKANADGPLASLILATIVKDVAINVKIKQYVDRNVIKYVGIHPAKLHAIMNAIPAL